MQLGQRHATQKAVIPMHIQAQARVAQVAGLQAAVVHGQQARQPLVDALDPVAQKGVVRKARVGVHSAPLVALDQPHGHAAQPVSKRIVAQKLSHHQPCHRIGRERHGCMAARHHQAHLHQRQKRQQGRAGDVGSGRHLGHHRQLLQARLVGHGRALGQHVQAQGLDLFAQTGDEPTHIARCGRLWQLGAQQPQHRQAQLQRLVQLARCVERLDAHVQQLRLCHRAQRGGVVQSGVDQCIGGGAVATQCGHAGRMHAQGQRGGCVGVPLGFAAQLHGLHGVAGREVKRGRLRSAVAGLLVE